MPQSVQAFAHDMFSLIIDHMQGKSGLPEQLRPLFWDYVFSQLSLAKDRDLIIRRVLSNGSWDAVRWLRKRLGDLKCGNGWSPIADEDLPLDNCGFGAYSITCLHGR